MKNKDCPAKRVCGCYEFGECEDCEYGRVMVKQVEKLRRQKKLIEKLTIERNAWALSAKRVLADTKNECVAASERLPDHEEFVLAIVSGKPKSNITLRGSYEIASYSKKEGWCVETFPFWERPTVIYWRELPSGPHEREKNVNEG